MNILCCYCCCWCAFESFWVSIRCIGFGLIISLVVAAYVVRKIFERLGEQAKRHLEVSLDRATAEERAVLADFQRYVGHVERLLYFCAAYWVHYDLIAGWFVLKAVVKFGDLTRVSGRRRAVKAAGAEAGQDETKAQLRLQAEYHQYFIGSGLSLLFGLAGGWLARKLQGW